MKLDLHELPKPRGRSKDIKDCALSLVTNSLFDKERVRGWWPVAGRLKEKDKENDSKSKRKSGLTVRTVFVVWTIVYALSKHWFNFHVYIMYREKLS